jgi:outer membrane immunogenic protein
MKAVLTALAALAATALSASAADILTKAPQLREPTFSWDGIYAGLNGACGSGTTSWNTAVGLASSFKTKGCNIGGTIGANFQIGRFVYGLEGDIDGSNFGGSLFASNPFGPSHSGDTSNTWLGTARVRAGYAIDRVLLYATGGAAFGDVKANGMPLAGSIDSAKFGWTVGAGGEIALTKYWTAKIEYLYISLANANIPLSTATCTILCASSAAISFNENIIRVGVNYKFNSF